MIKPQTLKGFRDFLPREARKRQYVIQTLMQVFEEYGFDPLETPALEYEDILLGKYGDEGDKLMYRFVDNGERNVSLRYDQTVPLARVVAQYAQNLPLPFKRYQIQPVWRAENTQKGRYREFLQCDVDIVASSSPLSDAEVMTLASKCLESLGISGFRILYNDRQLFNDVPKRAIATIDKLKKIGEDGVVKELLEKKIIESEETARALLRHVETKQPTDRSQAIMQAVKELSIDSARYIFTPTLARGLDYYTGLIFEIECDEYLSGSVCGGGRYDNLIGLFIEEQIPAVGFAFGFDRLMEAMEQFDLFPQELSTIQALVTIFSPDLKAQAITITRLLRENGVATELYLDENTKLEKQLKFADLKNIPYAVIIGPEEAQKEQVTLKNLKTREQKTVAVKELPHEII